MRAFIQVPAALSLASLCAGFAGCDPGAGSDPTTFHELMVALSQADCEASQRCCGGTGTLTCDSSLDEFFNRAFIDSQDLIDQGKAIYDARAGIQCLGAYRGQYGSCDAPASFLGFPSACLLILTGTTSIGGSCVSDQECMATTYCDASTTCRPYSGPSSDCSGGRCAPDTVCDFGSGACLPLAAHGQDCGRVPCDQSGPPLICGPHLTCVELMGEGSPCQQGTECLSGMCAGLPRSTCQPLMYKATVRGKLCGGP